MALTARKIVYKAGPFAGYDNDKAQILGKTLEGLGKSFKPIDVVNAARPKNSPTHDMYIWNDRTAAEIQRCEQARHYIKSLQIVIVNDGEESQTRAFHSVVISESDDHDERAFCHVNRIAQSADYASQVVDQAIAGLTHYQGRLSQYQEVFADMLRPLDQAITKLKKHKAK